MSSSSGVLGASVPAGRRVWVPALSAGFAVFSLAAFFQWLVYDDWLHDHGPLRVVGSLVAGLITFAFIYQWRLYVRQRELDRLRHAEALRHAQDLVRNSLQMIECVTYATDPESADPVRDAVDVIERTLEQALSGISSYIPPQVIEDAQSRGAAGRRDHLRP